MSSTSVEMGTAVSAEKLAKIKATFEEQGYCILKGVLPGEVVDGMIRAMMRLTDERLATFKAEGKVTDLHEDKPFATRLIHVAKECLEAAPAAFREPLHLPEVFPFLLNSSLLDIAEMFLGGEVRIYPNYMCRPKMPGDERTLIWWHQDAQYTANHKQQGNVEDLRTVNLWSPLLPARREHGCMQFAPKTHKLGLVPYHQKGIHLEIDNDALKPYLDQAVDIEVDPGDVVIFHNMLFHQGMPNLSDRIRWSVDWRFQDATQPTMRPLNGHVVRSRSNPAAAVRDAAHWAELKFQ
jgi:phytanoyl-CoA hydroxylase